jgi:hypothetical protein
LSERTAEASDNSRHNPQCPEIAQLAKNAHISSFPPVKCGAEMTGDLRQVPLGALIGLIMFIQVQVPHCLPLRRLASDCEPHSEPSSMKLISQVLICWAIEKCDEPRVSCARPWNADSLRKLQCYP